MRFVAKAFTILIFAFGLVGCGASGPRYNLIHDRIPALKASEGRIFFYRLKKWRPPLYYTLLWKPPVVLDGKRIGEAVNGGFFFVTLPGGTYEVGHCKEGSWGFTDKVEEHSKKVVELSAGQTRYIEMTRAQYQDFSKEVSYLRMILVSPERGNEAISGLKWVGSELTSVD